MSGFGALTANFPYYRETVPWACPHLLDTPSRGLPSNGGSLQRLQERSDVLPVPEYRFEQITELLHSLQNLSHREMTRVDLSVQFVPPQRRRDRRPTPS